MSEKYKPLVKTGNYLTTIKNVKYEELKWEDGTSFINVMFVLSFIYHNIEIQMKYNILEGSSDETVRSFFEGLGLYVNEYEMIHFNYNTLIGAKLMCYIVARKSDDGDYCYNIIERIVPYFEIPDDYWEYFRN